MSKILSANHDQKMIEIKKSVENFLREISKADKRLFTYQEIENILLDIYNLTKK